MWDKRHGVLSPEGSGDDNHVDILLKERQCFIRDVTMGEKNQNRKEDSMKQLLGLKETPNF